MVKVKKFNSNCNHFTGKKHGIKTVRKRVVRSKQEPHKNKYVRYSKCENFK